MKFQIMHEAPGMLRLRAVQCCMTIDQADLLEEYIRRIPGVDTVAVHERTSGVVIHYHGGKDLLVSHLASFSFESASEEIQIIGHTSRELNREYKEKIVFHVIKRYLKRLYLPAPIRYALHAVRAVPYVYRALRCLWRREISVDLLDGVAIGVSLLTGDFETAGSVMFLLRLGDYLDQWTHKKSIDDLAKRMSLSVDQVWLRTEDGQDLLLPIGQVRAGDRIVVDAGSLIPLDGEIVEGDVTVNQASLTGESVPVERHPGASVFAGTVLEEGRCVIRVKQAAGRNKYDQIVRMIEDSQKLSSQTETRAANLADRLVPWCLGGSALTYLLTRNLTRAVSVLMVDFSCALKLAMPLSVLSAMGEASAYHVTVKGGKYMERISEAETIIFDKTGTLTHACPRVVDVIPFGGNEKDEMLRVAACLEEHFPHSMANAVVRAAKERGLDHAEMHSRVEYIVAHGIASSIGEERAVIGSYHFVFEDEGVSVDPSEQARFDALPPEYSQLYLAIGGRLSAVICIADPLRREAKDVVRKLHNAGFSRVVMLTGDSLRTATAIAAEVGVDDFRAEVLPEDKAAFIQSEQEAGRTVVMIGDGINDAPALSYADVGVAIGSGAAIAREVADVTISAEDLMELVYLKRLSDALMARIRRNYRFVMGFNGGLIALGALGVLVPATSALLHNGSTLLISLGSMTKLLK
ncbi:MAG: heavy metal translocating P-type ATPase [Oscillospiraceae bacterium]|nr:heavy metal translocating P-type ATPase [Oscillospiraceae bacterium]